jgi:hypothetical protein
MIEKIEKINKVEKRIYRILPLGSCEIGRKTKWSME